MSDQPDPQDNPPVQHAQDTLRLGSDGEIVERPTADQGKRKRKSLSGVSRPLRRAVITIVVVIFGLQLGFDALLLVNRGGANPTLTPTISVATNTSTPAPSATAVLKVAMAGVASPSTALQAMQWTAAAYAALQDNQVERAALLAVRALKNGYNAQADAALLQAWQRLYLLQDFHPTPNTLPNTMIPVAGAAFSPDGTRFAVVLADTRLASYDAKTGRVLWVVGNSDVHNNSSPEVTFSPDGKTILTSAGTKILLWDAQSGQLLRTLSGHSYAIRSAVFSADGTQILTGSDDQSARLWDAETGNNVQIFATQDVNAFVYSAAISRDGSLVATGRSDGNLQIWDARTGAVLRSIILRPFDAVDSVAFSPDGKAILSGYYDGTLHLWDVQTAGELQVFAGHSGAINSVAFSPDGARVVSGSDDNTARLWDVKSGQSLRTFDGHVYKVNKVAFSADGQRVETFSAQNGEIQVWDANYGPGTLFNYGAYVTDVAYSPDGKMILTGNIQYMASGNSPDEVNLWDVQTTRRLRTFPNHRTDTGVNAFSPDGKQLAIANTIYGTATGQVIRRGPSNDSGAGIAYSPDGKLMLSGSNNGIATLWDVNTGQIVRTFSHSEPYEIISVGFSPDGTQALTASVGGAVYLWDVESGKQLKIFQADSALPNRIYEAAFSPDGKTILVGGQDPNARLWDVQSGQTTRIFNHRGSVYAVAFSPDGSRIATSSTDGSLRIWDTQTGEILRIFAVTNDSNAAPRSLAFSPDGKHLLSGGMLPQIWDVDYEDLINSVCGRLLRDLTGDERKANAITDSTPTCPQFASASTATPQSGIIVMTPAAGSFNFSGSSGSVVIVGMPTTTP